MPYESIPGTRATYLDGAFAIPNASTQPRILVVGPAKTGLTNELFTVTNVSLAESEFGSDTEILKLVHEAVAQGANNVAIMRSGGKRGEFVLTDFAGATLTIVPEYRDDDILGRYKLIIENDGTSNRYVIFDAVDEAYVYDSDEILVLDEGVISVEDSGVELMSTSATIATVILALSLDAAGLAADITTASASPVTIVATEGSDGQTVSRAERYAALESSYHRLDYKDLDMVVPADIYIDDKNIRDDDNKDAAGTGSSDAEKYGYYWKGVPAANSAEDALGFSWEYRYKGQVYSYMSDVEDYFSATPAAATLTVQTDLVLTAAKNGKGGNGVTLTLSVGSGGAVTTITETDHGFDIVVDIDGSSDTLGDVETSIAAALANSVNTLRSGVLPSTLIGVSSSGSATVASAEFQTNLAGGVGGALLSHEDLTGDAVPAAVTAKLAAGSDAQLREVNFAHQLASFCHVASTSWSQILGAISFKAPSAGYTRSKIADWVGVAPTLKDDGVDVFIDSSSDNGSGILGHRLISGEAKTSDGYRSHMIDNGDSTDGYAYGGLILTKGQSLPNGSDFPYGISDSDEALDSGGKPVDLGKYLFGTYSWPLHNNGFDGGSTYRGSVVATLLAKLATMVEHEEPIGSLGLLTNVSRPARIHSTQINDLAKFRISGLRSDLGGRVGFASVKTLAHPDSDYTRVSTIRSVNRMLTGIRSIARGYIGKAFNAQTLASLQAALDGFLLEERGRGTHQGAKTRIEYTRDERIMGRLNIKLRMVPPFSIEFIDVETSLAADESEL